jgi:hypothetical protein
MVRIRQLAMCSVCFLTILVGVSSACAADSFLIDLGSRQYWIDLGNMNQDLRALTDQEIKNILQHWPVADLSQQPEWFITAYNDTKNSIFENLSPGSTAPEPISSALFILGGITVGVVRHFKRRSRSHS